MTAGIEKPNTWIKNDSIWIDYYGIHWATKLFPVPGSPNTFLVLPVQVGKTALPDNPCDIVKSQPEPPEALCKNKTAGTYRPTLFSLEDYPILQHSGRGRPAKPGSVHRTTNFRRRKKLESLNDQVSL